MLFCFTTSVIAAQDAAVDPVEGIVLSLFERKCVTCHGADTQESGLRLDGKQFIALGGEHGPVVRAGKSRESELYQRITSKNADERMPPESEEPLSADDGPLGMEANSATHNPDDRAGSGSDFEC